MKVLVIGGAGYIGSHVVRELLDESYSVTVFDNLSSGLRINLQPEAAFIHGDIMRPEQLAAAMEGHDAIIHLAAFKAAGESMIRPEKYALNNLNGTINILNAATAAGVRRIVFSSSAAERAATAPTSWTCRASSAARERLDATGEHDSHGEIHRFSVWHHV